MTLIYLAVPYSHPDPAIRQQRFEIVNQVAATLMREGLHIFSPISHTHPITTCGDLPTSWEFWKEYDEAMLARCVSLMVLMLSGWRESIGVRAEIRIAENLGLPVRFIKWEA